MKGDYGKPRPVLVVQADQYAGHSSVTVALITSTLTDLPDLRLTIAPAPDNGLRAVSQVQLDRVQTIPNSRVKEVVGHLSPSEMTAVNQGLALFLGLV